MIELGDCTIFVLHKGQLASIRKADLLKIASEWQWVFANEVFIVFSQQEKIATDVRRGSQLIHCKPLIRFLCSRKLRKRRSKIVYVHVPKTGGTSMWASLTKALPSHVYYTSLRALLTYPPVLEDYDLIGLHFSPAILAQHLSEHDLVIGMVRDPTRCFLSGVLHSRRDSEDPETFTPSTRAMRELKLIEYLATDLGRFEARPQLITFGAEHIPSLSRLSDDRLLSSAVAFARRRNVILAPSERSNAFRNFLTERLSFEMGPLCRLNASEPPLWATHRSEFDRAAALIDSINVRGREFYDFVCRSFNELETSAKSRPRVFHARPLVSAIHPRALWRRASEAAVSRRGRNSVRALGFRRVSRFSHLMKQQL